MCIRDRFATTSAALTCLYDASDNVVRIFLYGADIVVQRGGRSSQAEGLYPYQVNAATCLRACYEKPGTDIAIVLPGLWAPSIQAPMVPQTTS
eukprot:2120036-Rhodomonas_salina.1